MDSVKILVNQIKQPVPAMPNITISFFLPYWRGNSRVWKEILLTFLIGRVGYSV